MISVFFVAFMHPNSGFIDICMVDVGLYSAYVVAVVWGVSEPMGFPWNKNNGLCQV